jgi:methylenetetrahydrofolate dehydrogenase (NADP+) / methenyltetrahydrofolate cyclohydrolase
MRQYLIAKLRERKLSCRRLQTNVAVQLDYYMSPQFAGMAAALVSGSYDGLNVSFLPTCPVGLEQDRVHQYQLENPAATCIGTVEQNIFIPNLDSNPSLRVKAVAAMFRRSPLCIASVSESFSSILAHEDTVPLLRRIFPNHPVSASSRATKVTDALQTSEEGTSLHAIQAYLTTEVPTLRRRLGFDPSVTMLEGLNGAKLGYGQVLFASDQSLECSERREIISKFVEATFNGWNTVIRNPLDGVKMVQEAKRILNLDDEANDHWYPSDEFQLEMLQLCNDFVKETFEGDRLGIIDVRRWNEATEWLLGDNQIKHEPNFGLEPKLWQVPENLLSGNELARTMMQEAKDAAIEFRKMYGRKPSLGVISVGELQRYKHADRRLQLYSNKMNSWFDKTTTGQFNEFEVQEINLDANATTDDVLSAIYGLSNVDGIQVMWPLPEHIHSPSVYNAIPLDQDVDGIHFVGQREIGHMEALPPVTAAGALALLKKYDIQVANQKVLVIGRSPIVGSPIANMLRAEDAIVTVAHSKVSCDKLENLVRESDIIFSCAGYPGLLKAEWMKQSIVINVGSTFINSLDTLQSDVSGDLAGHAHSFSPVPGGVGPLSAPMLFLNVVKAARAKLEKTGKILDGNVA